MQGGLLWEKLKFWCEWEGSTCDTRFLCQSKICVKTRDDLPQNTKLNYAHRQTNKTYKQQNTQTYKTDINKQTTNKNNKQKKSGPNSRTEIMRDYGGR